MNNNFQTINSLEGVALNGSISVDASSDIRRNATIKFVITDSTFEISPSSKIWLDKYIKLSLGIDSLTENRIVYSNMGIFVIDAPTYEYDVVNNSIQVSLLDLMCKLTGLRNGYISATSILIPAGTNIREAMINTLALGGFTQYVCEEAPSPSVVPMDLNFSQGTTIYAILSALRDIYPNYEIYFDTEGVFHYNPIPTGKNEPIQIDDDLWKNIVISEKIDVDFQNIKNYIEVYGRTHDPAYFPSSVTVNDNQITLTIAEIEDYEEDVIYGFTLTYDSESEEIINPVLRINNKNYYSILSDSGIPITIVPETIPDQETTEVYYCIQYVANSESGGVPYWRWLGHLQAYGEAKDEDENSPFYINGNVGIIRLPLYGGEYENCITDELAQIRASYELYTHTNMQNTLNLICAPVNWLEVNTLVSYTSQRNNETNLYLIKTISFGFDIDDTMEISMIKYYPEQGRILEITSQPTATEAYNGYEALFNIEAIGEELIYKWQYSIDGIDWIDLTYSTANTASLSFVVNASMNNYKYRCIVQDRYGETVISSIANLTVITFAIVQQPQDVVTTAGTQITFSVVAIGEGLTYRWQYKTRTGTTWTNSTAASATTSTLITTVQANFDGRKYRCKVTNSESSTINSEEALLTVV